MKSNKNNIYAVFFILAIFGLNGCAAIIEAVEKANNKLEELNANVSFDQNGVAIVPVKLDYKVERKREEDLPIEGIITGVITSNIRIRINESYSDSVFITEKILIPKGTPIEAEYTMEPSTVGIRVLDATNITIRVAKINTTDKTIVPTCRTSNHPKKYCILQRDSLKEAKNRNLSAYLDLSDTEKEDLILGDRLYTAKGISDSDKNNPNYNDDTINTFARYYNFMLTIDQLKK